MYVCVQEDEGVAECLCYRGGLAAQTTPKCAVSYIIESGQLSAGHLRRGLFDFRDITRHIESTLHTYIMDKDHCMYACMYVVSGLPLEDHRAGRRESLENP